jgi:aspartyl-tRNA(Asn)/glutamyl-tRNA(Gln) amidotransferase subunit A
MKTLDLDLRSMRAALANGETTADKLCTSALERAQQAATLNALISTLQTPIGNRGGDGALAGIPFVHKDNFCLSGSRTTCASRMLENFVAPYDATVSARLRNAGAQCIGKANMDEFAMGSSNEHSYFGSVKNPWDHRQVPGGSSGGSAALVAAGVVPFATGSDTGGSIRQPAAFCGVTGLKPTYGRVSRYGLVAYASSLDVPGVLARSAADCADVLQVIAGHDPLDGTSSTNAVPNYRAALNLNLRGIRIGIPRCWIGDGISANVRDSIQLALRELERGGAVLVDIDLPNAALAIPAYYVIAPAEASSNLNRFDGVRFGHRCAEPKSLEDLYLRSRSEGFGVEVQKRILIGTYALSAGYYDAYYGQAQRARRVVSEDFLRAFEQVDILAGPTAPTTAFGLGEKLSDPLAMYAADVNTVALNLAGLPGISVPCGFANGLPIGLQFAAPHFAEDRLLGVANAYQQRSEYHRMRPGAQS